jgi:hypothetical protein
VTLPFLKPRQPTVRCAGSALVILSIDSGKTAIRDARNGVRRGKTERWFFRALQGHQTVAGGNTPGKRDDYSPDPEGVALP